MIGKLGIKLAGGAKLRAPVFLALAIAFSALWLVFTFTLDVWATSDRQEGLSELVEQVDDQIFRKSEDIGYQLLSSANLISSNENVISAIENNNEQALYEALKAFYQTSSSHSLVNKVQIFDVQGNSLSNLGIGSYLNHINTYSSQLIDKADSQSGVHISENGEINLYAIISIVNNQQTLGYIQLTKPYTDLVNELASLNKVELFLMANKQLINRTEAEQNQLAMGIKAEWELFDQLLMCSLTQGSVDIHSLAPVVNNALLNHSVDDLYMQDKLQLSGHRMNLGLIPIYDSNNSNIGRIVLLKNIDETYAAYQASLIVTSVSFAVIITLIFISFWVFLGRIENNIAAAELEIIKAKEQAEQSRDEAEKAKQQAEEANKIKSEFLAKMSHELRTPLNAIIGISEIMAEDAQEFGDDDYVEPLGRVLRSGKHLLSLINDILDLSKIEAGKMELHPECFDLPMFIADINRTCEPLADKNCNTMEVNFNADISEIYADSTRLKQVILNLISNACKFTNDGTVSLTIENGQIDNQAAVIFKVKDSGIGMNAEQTALLFQDFQQVDSSATRKYEGTGLGLSISQKLSKLMGGNIRVDSELEKGSTFTVTLPLNSTEIEMDLAKPTQPTVINEVNNTDSEHTVLVVEDDENMVQMLKHHFDKVKIHVEVANDGNQALAKARAHKPSLITLDINMPNLNGWDTLAAMRADEELKDIPIVVMTVQEEKRKGIDLGASEYLTKPINKTDVEQLVERFIGVSL